MGAIEAGKTRSEHVDELNNLKTLRTGFDFTLATESPVPTTRSSGVFRHLRSRVAGASVYPKLNLDDIVAGAVGLNDHEMGYNAEFLYPREGGIQTVANALAESIGYDHIVLNARVEGIDLDARCVTLTDGREYRFENLVNTTALPFFIDALKSCPERVSALATSLSPMRWSI